MGYKDFYSKIRSKDKKVTKCSSKLSNLYKSLPHTTGCMENIASGHCCKGWCCKFQTPQILYCEFLKIWNFIVKKWDNSLILDLIEKCMRNAADPSPSKGCVFFNSSTCLCNIHTVRPYACRIYGITPAEEFNTRYERLKEQYKNMPWVVLKPQCDLVKTEDGSNVTVEDTTRWWNKLVEIEKRMGVDPSVINDDSGGSYRSPHDHLLVYTMPDNVLNAISGIRLYDNWMDKLERISEFMSVIKEHFKVK